MMDVPCSTQKGVFKGLKQPVIWPFYNNITELLRSDPKRHSRDFCFIENAVQANLLAATALEHGLILGTRNIKDVKRTGVSLLNPFLP
jgi:predicted nucleic acid-binding protein